MKQIIPYIVNIVILDSEEDYVFGYIRDGNEDRLTGKWSFGFGGYVNEADLNIGSAILRELSEELNDNVNYYSIVPSGYINLDNTPVNRVHFGIVCKAIAKRAKKDIRLKGSENKSGMWLNVDDLNSMQFEDWSEIIKPVVIGWLQK